MYHFNIISKTKTWYTISAILVILSIASLFIFRLNLGIDFTGGSMMDIEFNERPLIDDIKETLSEFELQNLKIQPIGDKGYILKMADITEEKHQQILSKLNENFNQIEEKRFDSIGPIIGKELKEKSVWAIIIVLIAIVLYIAYVFRKVSKPVASWKYGISAIIALAHDIIIIMGIFCVLGYIIGVEIDSFFISALLVILGFSVNDTIVTFDRVRENLHKKQHLTFKELINESINETLTRSINTSLTTFAVLISVFLFGGETIKFFVLALMLGVIIGTYSSIFIASPLLLFWYRRKYKQSN